MQIAVKESSSWRSIFVEGHGMKVPLVLSSVVVASGASVGCGPWVDVLDVGGEQTGAASIDDAGGAQPLDAGGEQDEVAATADGSVPSHPDEGESDAGGCGADAPPVGTYSGPGVSTELPDVHGTITITLTTTGASVSGSFVAYWTTPGLSGGDAPLAGSLNCDTGDIDLAGTASAGQTYTLDMTYSPMTRSLVGTYAWTEDDSALVDMGAFTLTWSPPDGGSDGGGD
jgi:hypothetical protein